MQPPHAHRYFLRRWCKIHEAQRHDVDLVVLLVLALHLRERATARGAHLVRLVEVVLDVDPRQLRLRGGTVPTLRLLVLVLLRLLALATRRRGLLALATRRRGLLARDALLRAGAEQLLGQLGDLLLECFDAKLPRDWLTFELRKLVLRPSELSNDLS
jgi:hypothetical protein